MKYPSDANVSTTASSLNRKRRSSGDLSKVSQRYERHVLFGFSATWPWSEAGGVESLALSSDLVSRSGFSLVEITPAWAAMMKRNGRDDERSP